MKFSDEQLSRVLTAHEQGGLARGGDSYKQGYPCCLFQCAAEVQQIYEFTPTLSREEQAPAWEAIHWFDREYDPKWTTQRLLEELDSQGLI